MMFRRDWSKVNKWSGCDGCVHIATRNICDDCVRNHHTGPNQFHSYDQYTTRRELILDTAMSRAVGQEAADNGSSHDKPRRKCKYHFTRREIKALKGDVPPNPDDRNLPRKEDGVEGKGAK